MCTQSEVFSDWKCELYTSHQLFYKIHTSKREVFWFVVLRLMNISRALD